MWTTTFDFGSLSLSHWKNGTHVSMYSHESGVRKYVHTLPLFPHHMYFIFFTYLSSTFFLFIYLFIFYFKNEIYFFICRNQPRICYILSFNYILKNIIYKCISINFIFYILYFIFYILFFYDKYMCSKRKYEKKFI